MLSNSEFLEIFNFRLVNVVYCFAIVSRFGTEKEHQYELHRDEDNEDMEQPFPTKIRDNRSRNDCRPKPSDRTEQISYMFEMAPATKLNNDTLKPRSCTKYMSLQLGYQVI